MLFVLNNFVLYMNLDYRFIVLCDMFVSVSITFFTP